MSNRLDQIPSTKQFSEASRYVRKATIDNIDAFKSALINHEDDTVWQFAIRLVHNQLIAQVEQMVRERSKVAHKSEEGLRAFDLWARPLTIAVVTTMNAKMWRPNFEHMSAATSADRAQSIGEKFRASDTVDRDRELIDAINRYTRIWVTRVWFLTEASQEFKAETASLNGSVSNNAYKRLRRELRIGHIVLKDHERNGDGSVWPFSIDHAHLVIAHIKKYYPNDHNLPVTVKTLMSHWADGGLLDRQHFSEFVGADGTVVDFPSLISDEDADSHYLQYIDQFGSHFEPAFIECFQNLPKRQAEFLIARHKLTNVSSDLGIEQTTMKQLTIEQAKLDEISQRKAHLRVLELIDSAMAALEDCLSKKIPIIAQLKQRAKRQGESDGSV